MSPDTNLFGGDRRAGLQGALRSYQAQRTNPGAGVDLGRKEGALAWEQKFPLKALSCIQGHLFLLCGSALPMWLSVQTTKEEVRLSVCR